MSDTSSTAPAAASTSIFGTIETDAVNFWDNDVKPFFSDDVEPFFKSALLLIERNGGTLLMQSAVTILNDVGDIAEGKWGDVVNSIITTAKSLGAQTVTEEEQLAASTALQIAQAVQAAPTTATATATTTAATVVAAGASS